MPAVIAHGTDPDLGPLPQVMISYLRDRHIEARLHPVDQFSEDMSFPFKRVVFRDPKVQLANSYDHLISLLLGQTGLDLLHFIGFDDIAGFDVIKILDPDTALKTLRAFLHIILEPSERTDTTIIDHYVVP